MKELWTGLFELLTPPTESGNTGCYTNVVAWAADADDFRAKVTRILERNSWFVVNVEDCRAIAVCIDMSDELAEQVETASTRPEDCIHGTLHYFPSKPA